MDWRPKMTVINWRNTEVSKGLLCFCPRMIKRNIFLLSILFLFAPPTPVVTSVFSLQCMIHIMRVGRQKGAEQVEGLQLIRTGIELLLAQTMARYGPCILRN